MGDFAKIAPYLQNPLVLAGFAIFLVLGIHRTLIRSGIIPKLSARSGSQVLRSLLRYGFVMALAVIACGFGLEYFKVYRDMAGNREMAQALNRVYDTEGAAEPHVSFVRLIGRLEKLDRTALEQTTREAERILQENGVNITADNLVRLGGLYVALTQYDKANATFLDAVREDPKNTDAYAGLAMANQLMANESMRVQDYDKAEDQLQKAEGYAKLGLQDDPGNESLIEQMGYVQKELASYYADKGDATRANKALASAAQLFSMAIGANPKDAGSYNGLGDIYFQMGEYDKAIKEFETATKLIPGYTFAWHDLALALYTKYQHNNKPDPDTLRDLLQALQKVYELQISGTAQQLPQGAWAGIQKIKDWALAEAARLKKDKSSASSIPAAGSFTRA
jgi:tetratricopeptide (TPR) repeat protein